MSDLPPGLEQFGNALRDAAEAEVAERRRGRWRRRLRGIGLPLLAVMATAAVGAAAVQVVDGGSGTPIAPAPDDGPGLRAAEDPAVVVATATEDPAGGPPWVVRVYTDAAGRECAQAGRLRDGRFGQVQGGRFRALPPSAPGSCADEQAREPLLAIDRHSDPGRTVVFGVGVDRAPVTVRIGQQVRRAEPAGLGTFVTVFRGAEYDSSVAISATVNGRSVRRVY